MGGALRWVVERALGRLPRRLRDTLSLRAFGLWRVPMIAWVTPVVEELDLERCVVRIPLRRRTRNHVRSMYLGVFAVGADAAAGMLAMQAVRAADSDVVPIFKDFHADFLARAEGDVLFTCAAGPAIRAAVERAAASGERVNLSVQIVATVPDKLGDSPVARLAMTISLKRPRRR